MTYDAEMSTSSALWTQKKGSFWWSSGQSSPGIFTYSCMQISKKQIVRHWSHNSLHGIQLPCLELRSNSVALHNVEMELLKVIGNLKSFQRSSRKAQMGHGREWFTSERRHEEKWD
ncbi:hypothetical protein GJ744_001278 [Endocarpon pusillum]|uniref:Uncharacterized protein n=1 Tax=Endocarpon pusillum TaxID=364733 RepID=A0A8H7DZJ1_9EURO|nr:hypothetical protein GJ744_001278 [Endocarpon pusillum]